MNSINNTSEVSQIVSRFGEIKELRATLSHQVKVFLEKELPIGYSLSVIESLALGSTIFIGKSGTNDPHSTLCNNHCVSIRNGSVTIHKTCTTEIYEDLSKIIHILIKFDLTQISETIKIIK